MAVLTLGVPLGRRFSTKVESMAAVARLAAQSARGRVAVQAVTHVAARLSVQGGRLDGLRGGSVASPLLRLSVAAHAFGHDPLPLLLGRTAEAMAADANLGLADLMDFLVVERHVVVALQANV